MQHERKKMIRQIREVLWKRFRWSFISLLDDLTFIFILMKKIWIYRCSWSSIKLQNSPSVKLKFQIGPVWTSTLSSSRSMDIYNLQLRENTRSMSLWITFWKKIGEAAIWSSCWDILSHCSAYWNHFGNCSSRWFDQNL